MQFHLQEVTEALQKINPILASSDPHNYEIEDMAEVILNSCIQLISMAYLKSKDEGFVFDTWCKQSNAFKDFLELYGEFCSHVFELCMKDMEVDDMLVEVLTKLRERV